MRRSRWILSGTRFAGAAIIAIVALVKSGPAINHIYRQLEPLPRRDR